MGRLRLGSVGCCGSSSGGANFVRKSLSVDRLSVGMLAGWMALACAVSASAQQVTSTLPVQTTRDGFYEMFGLHWGFRLGGPNGGVFFDNGGFGPVAPGVGGFDPNSAAQFGFARGGTNGGFFMNFMAAQGSDRSMTTAAPMLTLPNGGSGAVWNSTITPFVTGWIPVVGQNPYVSPPLSPLEERVARLRRGETPGVRSDSPSPPVAQAAADDGHAVPPLGGRKTPRAVAPAVASSPAAAASSSAAGDAEPALATSRGAASDRGTGIIAGSSAGRGDLSVAEIRRQQEAADAERDAQIHSLVAQAEEAAANAKPGVARIFYQQAARLATGPLQRKLEAKARQLR